jgi:hypothetical protein
MSKKKAYKSLSRQLDRDISNKLQPLPQSKARPPSFFRYNGGSKGDDSNYSFGDPIVRFFPKTTLGTKDLELSFITQAGQSYNINYNIMEKVFPRLKILLVRMVRPISISKAFLLTFRFPIYILSGLVDNTALTQML